MGDYPGIYKGANYGFDREESFEPLIPAKYRINPGQFGVTTDPRSANQLKEVSDKFNTGAKTVEVSGISTEVLESMPDQHLKEIARLKRLAGADITFHGPLVEPTGFNQQGNWEEANRVQAERQIWDAVKRGQQMMIKNVSEVEKGKKAQYQDDNLVVTLHTSNGLLAPYIKMKDEKTKKESVESVAVIDEYTGNKGYLPVTEDYFEGTKKNDPEKEIQNFNQRSWLSSLHNISREASRGKEYIDMGLRPVAKEKNVQEEEISEVRELYKLYKEDRKQYNELMQHRPTQLMKLYGDAFDEKIDHLAQGDMDTRDSYDQMKEMYNKARDALERTKDTDPNAKKSWDELEEFKKKNAQRLKAYKDDPLKVKEFADGVAEGIRVLSSLPSNGIPQQYRKIEDFGVDKASQTFANVARRAYDEFGQNAPILSLENPPVGMGLSRAEEIKKLVDESRRKLREDLEFNKGLSKEEAKNTADKLIGVTWDVGHINMLKKYGYDNEDLRKQTEIMKPYLKHVHLSDNFGLEHTELPMGMGNVPMKEHLEVIGKDMQKMKAIIETGGHWYQDFKSSPLPESLAAFGSPIYPMQMQPYWDRAQAQVGSYFSGYGFNPEVHHSIYGSGFAGLPTELGGSVQGRNRLSGTPID